MTCIISAVPTASFQAPTGMSSKPLHHVMEIRAAFHPLFVTHILYQGSFMWLCDQHFGGIESLQEILLGSSDYPAREKLKFQN